MKKAIFISARLKSTRLPHKSILMIKGRTTIEHLIDRMKLSKKKDSIVFCTSTNEQDQPLVKIALQNGIEVFKGSEDDKLERYLKAAEQFGIGVMVIVDGDDLFCDFEYIDKIFGCFETTDADFVYTENLPFGVNAHGIKYSALKTVCDTKKQADTEVWGDYFFKNPQFKKINISASPEVAYPDIRMSLDYQEDFDFFVRVFAELGPRNTFSLVEIVNLLKKKPEIRKINESMQKAYEENIIEKKRKVEVDLQ